MLDADAVLGLTERLRSTRDLLDDDRLSQRQRTAAHRRLREIADVATRDLDDAREQLGRLEVALARQLRA